jgi:cation diffusion facilitator family transporter
MLKTNMKKPSLTRFAWLSIAAALVTIALKTGAWWVTGSVGLLSDALESIVNLAGAVMALAMLTVAARPPDEDHPHGHGKAEYFSSGVEGTLILIAALGIAATAVPRLINPKPLDQIGLGIIISIAASLVNLGVALLLLKEARKHRSITLEANARHLLTDVWTSLGVLIAVVLVAVTDWERFDPIIALVVAGQIVWTGTRIVRKSVAGLMDAALPPEDKNHIESILASYACDGVRFYALRTRQGGAQRFISMHVLVPGDWTVSRGHQLLESLEARLRSALPNSSVITHIEPLDDPAALEDQYLERDDVPVVPPQLSR